MSTMAVTTKCCEPAWDELYVEIGALLTQTLAGIGRFIARLVEALSALRPLRLINTFHGRQAKHMRLRDALPPGQEIFVPHSGLPSADSDMSRWVSHLLDFPRTACNRATMQRGTTLFTSLRPPERRSRREIGILYDLCPLLFPWTQVEMTREFFTRFYEESAPLCDRIVAISNSTARDARWLSTIPTERITTAYPGPSMCVRQHASAAPVVRRKNIILVVSTLEPRKNADFLIDWFRDTMVLDNAAELWWAGPKGWLWKPNRRGSRAGRRTIRFLGHVSDRRLCELYRRAAFTIYPSLYEGFGFPVLDSLRHKAPVLCGFHSSVQEFEGPGVHYFDAYDAISLDEACGQLLSEQAGTDSLENLDSRFSWDRLAQQMVALCD
jgi:glycosyltransferase involved in cell wall biosynthesis